MTDLLVGHSSFYLRNGWLKKGIEYILKNNSEDIFSKSNIKAIDELGIGSVMVQSLRFWLIMLDIIEKKDKKYCLKREIEYILKKDPYLQKIDTLWLLHTYIMERDKNEENPILWNLFIGDKKNSVFTEEEARNIGSLSNSVGEKTNKFSSNSSAFRWSYFVANKLLLIKILALK